MHCKQGAREGDKANMRENGIGKYFAFNLILERCRMELPIWTRNVQILIINTRDRLWQCDMLPSFELCIWPTLRTQTKKNNFRFIPWLFASCTCLFMYPDQPNKLSCVVVLIIQLLLFYFSDTDTEPERGREGSILIAFWRLAVPSSFRLGSRAIWACGMPLLWIQANFLNCFFSVVECFSGG